LFLRCSGVAGGDEEGEEGVRVGVDALDGSGSEAGSKSRSGIGGESKGRLVIRNKRRRRIALTEMN
jgi:hypothetical protein